MMTIEEIESACDRSQPLDFSRHPQEGPELSIQETFYPLGFPTELRTNSAEILSQAGELWSVFEPQFHIEPIRVDVHVMEGNSLECPPSPVVRILQPLLVDIADRDNYSLVNFEAGRTQVTISRAVEKQKDYLRYFLLGSSPLYHIATRHTTPVHAACVALNGRGVLLCGDSGAGKSSLSYACARSGWTYVTDNSSYLVNEHADRVVTGNCHQLRFRPSAVELFPELEGREITPRAAGFPSIELPTALLPDMVCAQTARAEFVVFLNRDAAGPPELVPYRKDVARYFMRQVLYGSAKSLARQYQTIERLLTVDILMLRYTDLDWAVERLQTLVREGR